MSTFDWLFHRSLLSPNKIALIDTLRQNRAISYRAWNEASSRSARFFSERCSVLKGDRIAVLSMNCVEILDVLFAAQKLGAVMQPLNYRLSAPELLAQIEDAEPKVLLYGPDCIELARALRSVETKVRAFVALDEKYRCFEGDLAFSMRDALDASNGFEPALKDSDPWVLCYTGGTTGSPKGAILTHRSITANSINTIVSWGITHDDIAILNAPLFHTGGLNVFTTPLVHAGGCSIVCRQFDVNQVFELLDSAGVTLLFGVPSMFQALQRDPRFEGADFSRLKIVISGGAPCPMPIFERFWARGLHFKTGYGLTEAGPNTFWLPNEDVRRKPGAVGFPLFHIDVELLAKDGRPARAGEVGELRIRGPHVFGGYWNKPAETAIVLGDDGWLRTGDLAVFDEEGYFSIVGRLKEMLISGGENVYPAEIESVLQAHPDVIEAAVIGVPHSFWGEVGRAFVLRSKDSLSAEELLDFCSQRLARYKIPKSIVFVSALPRTAAGKIDKVRLKNI